MRGALALLLCLVVLPAAAQVYRSVNPDGSVEFSDQAAPGARPVDLAPLPTVSPVQVPPRRTPRPVEEVASYRQFAVTSPGPDEAVRANDGNVTIDLALDPALLPGHRIVLRLDGEPVGEPSTSPSVSLVNLDRGTHRLEAAVIDGAGNPVIQAEPVTFHVLRVHLGTPPNPAPRPAR